MQIIDLQFLSQEKKLFYHMHHGLKKAKNIKQYAIFLIGEIRSGKSTTFNWITNPSCLVGQGNEISSHYLLREESEKIALVKKSYESVTLVQNMHAVEDNGKNALLIDLPGFHDSRTVNEVMLVNFIINCCFSHSINAKFILVISKNQFLNTNGNAFMNTVKEFVKYFRKFSVDQRKNVYKSASLLITSVNVKSYDSYKQMFLIKLVQNLNNIKDLRVKNEQIKAHYDHMEQLLLQIIHNKRLQFFKMAKDGQSPSDSPIIQQFNCCDWQFYNLGAHLSDITYPYNEFYQKISQEDQEKMDSQVIKRVKQFEPLQGLLAKIVEDYLQAPYDRQMNLSQHFASLQQFTEKNRVHNDILFMPQIEQSEIMEEESKLRPIKIFRNIQKLLYLTFQVQDNGCRSIEQQRNVSYFDYLLSYFKKTIDYFSDSFATIPKYQQILNILLQVFSQIIQELKYITQINDELKSSCSRRLKQAILVMNKTSHFKEDIPKPFLNGLIKEEFEEYEIQQLEQTIDFLNNLNWEELDPRMKYYISSKCHKAMAVKMRQNREYKMATLEALACFEDYMKYNCCQQIKKSRKSTKYKDQGKEKDFEQFTYRQILQQIYFSLYKTQKDKIVSLLIKNQLILIVQQSLPQLERISEGGQSIILLQDYAAIYDTNRQYQLARSIYKRLEKHPEIKRNKKKLKQFQQKSAIAQKRLYTSIKKANNQDKDQLMNDEKKVLKLVNEIRLQILKMQEEYSKEAMMDEIKIYYKQKNEEANISQFQYKLSRDPTYSDIIVVSERLIKQIKNRKAVLMFGKRSGKTSAYYWLMKKSLITKMVGHKRYAYQLAFLNIQNRINHKGFTPTRIPNIGYFQPGEVLIDLQSLFHKKIINIMIQLKILKRIFENCDGIKILMVGKEEDICKDDGTYLLKIIEFCLSFLPLQENLSSHFALLISYFENTKKYQDFFQEFINQFQQSNHPQQFQERYGVKFSNKQHYKEIISSIFSKNKILTFPKASQISAPESNFPSFSNQEVWRYIECSQLRKDQLKTHLERLRIQTKEIQAANSQINFFVRSVKANLRRLRDVFYNSIQNQQLSSEFLLQIDPSLTINWKHDEQLSYQKYSQIFFFNQIFPLFQLSRLTQQIQCYDIPIEESNQIIVRLINSMKKLKFTSSEGMIAISWIQTKYTEVIIPLKTINQFRFQFDFELSDLRFILFELNWIFYHEHFFAKFMQKYIKEINIDKLIKEMMENQMSIRENLIKFIQKCYEIQKQLSCISHIQLQLKISGAAKRLKQLMLKQQNHQNSLYTCIVLFDLQYKRYHEASQKNQESLLKEQVEVDFKIGLLQILKEITVILACLNESFAFSICDSLQCDTCKCGVFDKLVSIRSDKKEILRLYLDFCLDVGLKNQYIQLCSKFTAIADDESQRQMYNSIKHEILAGSRIMMNRKKTAYDNVKNIKVSDLQQIFMNVKLYWELHQ